MDFPTSHVPSTLNTQLCQGPFPSSCLQRADFQVQDLELLEKYFNYCRNLRELALIRFITQNLWVRRNLLQTVAQRMIQRKLQVNIVLV